MERHRLESAHPYADFYRYFLRDEEGNIVQRRGWGGSYPGNMWPMKPGQSFEQEIDLNRYFEIDEPGKYTLSLFVVPTVHPAECEKGILSNTIGMEFKTKEELIVPYPHHPPQIIK